MKMRITPHGLFGVGRCFMHRKVVPSNSKEEPEMELDTNLAFWVPAMFFLGLILMALVYLFLKACEKI